MSSERVVGSSGRVLAEGAFLFQLLQNSFCPSSLFLLAGSEPRSRSRIRQGALEGTRVPAARKQTQKSQKR